MHCKGKGRQKPTYEVMQVGEKLMDSCWVARYFKKGHDVAKADRKHKWLRTSLVQVPPFGKFAKMVEEGESSWKATGRQQVCVVENALL